ncbi:Aste57867_17457 [Aphanomyces stellatus]|uniref:Aste57867_17457 protein n=1 Tax=Aphanomyces stellatus TaxID=120398 RepID=A0A485L827_9STRA|nr:hypothetical protein As57867_017397 [Aphanomyces stellatus]VFT94211.1 Aste57867_17457 [Aphanomyces stellatus]
MTSTPRHPAPFDASSTTTVDAVTATDDCVLSILSPPSFVPPPPKSPPVRVPESVARLSRNILSYRDHFAKRVSLMQDARFVPLRSRFMLHPVGLFRRVWDVLLALWVIYVCWYVPFSVAISWWSASPSLLAFHSFLDVFFVLDIFLNFRTAVVLYGELVQEPRAVAKIYVQTWFLVDFISVFPTDSVVAALTNTTSSDTSTKGVKLLKYVKLPKLLRLSQLVRRFRRFQRYEGSLTIICAFLFLLHVAGCIWIVAVSPCDDPTNSQTIEFCAPSAAYDVYSLGFHYAVSMLSGMSLDVIYATDNPLGGGFKNMINNVTTSALPSGLLLLSNIYGVIGIIMSSVVVGSSVFVVESWNRAGYQFRKRIDMINHEMEFLQLPEYLRNRIKAYHQYLWTHQGSATEKVSLLQDTGMSEPLRKEIAIFMYRDMLSKIPIFLTATDQLIGMICLSLSTVIYLPKDKIITRGEIGKDLFIVSKGCVVVCADVTSPNEEDRTDVVLHPGSFFGEIGLLMDIERTRTVIAGSICELGVLTKKDFTLVMRQFPSFATEIERLVEERQIGGGPLPSRPSAAEGKGSRRLASFSGAVSPMQPPDGKTSRRLASFSTPATAVRGVHVAQKKRSSAMGNRSHAASRLHAARASRFSSSPTLATVPDSTDEGPSCPISPESQSEHHARLEARLLRIESLLEALLDTPRVRPSAMKRSSTVS